MNNLSQFELLRDYIEQKRRLHAAHNGERDPADVNARHMTNIGLFRVYAERYLQQLASQSIDDEDAPRICTDGMTLLVRQLAPDADGLPVEIVAFCAVTNWRDFEAIQADIFDHLLAVLPQFGLRAFQNVSDRDERLTLQLANGHVVADTHATTDA